MIRARKLLLEELWIISFDIKERRQGLLAYHSSKKTPMGHHHCTATMLTCLGFLHHQRLWHSHRCTRHLLLIAYAQIHSVGSFIDVFFSEIVLEHLGKDAHSIHLGINLDSGLGVFDGFLASLCMILVSEIGDETFIIAALMAMRHPRSIVLSGALSALFVMTVLSTGLGRIVPNLISRKHTNSAATVLYAFFGLRLLYIAWRSDSKASQKKEMEEVEEKLEGGQGKTSIRRFFSRFCTPIFLESFILTFLAEWGDRSQIATIALATHKNALGVCVGAMLGHSVCTSLAVVGGSMLASKISQRTVATVGGFLFLGFSLSSYFYPPL